jgi:hypothetical protein
MADLLRGKSNLPPDVKTAVDQTPPAETSTPAQPPASAPPQEVARDPVAARQSDAAAEEAGPPEVPGQAAAVKKLGDIDLDQTEERGSEQPKFNAGSTAAKREAKDKDLRGYTEAITEHPWNEGVEHGNDKDHPHLSAKEFEDKVKAHNRGEDTSE